jgi:hypothetical protein
MSQFYNIPRTRGLYNSKDKTPFKISRSKIELSLECPRCFYLDRKCGVGRPPGFPFNLNSAVDTLLKREFDQHRVSGTQHPIQENYNIDAFPVAHDELDDWRHNFTGVQVRHEPTNFIVFGAIDDLWQNSDDEYVVVDYKATSKSEPIEALDKEWHDGYKRQMEIYQWLLRQKGYTVSDTGYFVYCNGDADKEAFDARLEFDVTLIPYTGSDDWVEDAIIEAKNILERKTLPDASSECDYCRFFDVRKELEERYDSGDAPTQGSLLS